jgi:hypothetical protein
LTWQIRQVSLSLKILLKKHIFLASSIFTAIQNTDGKKTFIKYYYILTGSVKFKAEIKAKREAASFFGFT